MTVKLALAASSLLTVAISAPAVVAQQPRLSEEAVVVLGGSWAGRIVIDEVRGQDVLWRFERTASGEFTGFMGPAAAGSATIPMQNIASDGSALSLTVESQNGQFVGTISRGQATGTWRQGQSGRVNFTRSALDRPGGSTANGGPFASVIGQWEGRQGDNREGPPMAYFRFALGPSNELVGFAGGAPAAMNTPLAKVSLDGSTLTFQPPSQGPAVRRFTIDISGDAGTGTLFEGVEARMTMDKTAR